MTLGCCILRRVKRMALVMLAACSAPSSSVDIDAPASRGDVPPSTGSRCAGDATLVCERESMELGNRTVTYQVPLGTPPAAGWPVVVFFQGSFIPGAVAFEAARNATFGQYQLTSTVKALLDRGYAVIAPNALGDGSQYWQTNVPPYATSWAGCADDVFVRQLLSAIDDGTFGDLDSTRQYAMGISSGGFMTSRMAVSYAGTFRALVIASASYATCSAICSVPALPADHPPTLLVHGADDTIVPLSAMEPYRDALGGKAETLVDDTAGHEWLEGAVTAIPAFFDAH